MLAKDLDFNFPEGVLVGSVFGCTPNKNWRWEHAAHLFPGKACAKEDFHRFARSVGLNRGWFQNRDDFPHYDLTPAMQKKAIRSGATLVNTRTEVGVFWTNRDTRIAAEKLKAGATK